MSRSTRRWAPVLAALVALLVAALIIQGVTGSAAAAWAAFGLLLAVMLVRFLWLS